MVNKTYAENSTGELSKINKKCYKTINLSNDRFLEHMHNKTNHPLPQLKTKHHFKDTNINRPSHCKHNFNPPRAA